MAFSDFHRLSEVVKKFKLQTRNRLGLFASCPEVAPSKMVLDLLRVSTPLATAIDTEKARSEMIVAPLLVDLTVHAPAISLFSGVDLNVDPAQGLSGTCDFLLSRSPEQFMVTAPVVALVEADMSDGLAQCLAEMVAAQMFNQKEANDVGAVYGGVTTGTVWRFLVLKGTTVTLDTQEYLLSAPDKVLGVLVAMAQGTAPEA